MIHEWFCLVAAVVGYSGNKQWVFFLIAVITINGDPNNSLFVP